MAMFGNRTLKVAQYCLMPQIFPRFASLVFGGFSYLAYFVAQVYRGVRLLPEGHPYLNPSEIGNFSIPNVIAEAGKRLKYRMENIDQVIMFYVILMGMVLLAAQTLFLLIGMFAPQAMALSLTDFFGNAHLTRGGDQYQDLAFIMLDRVFGVPGIFNSCVSVAAAPCYMAAPNDTWDIASTVYKPATFPWPFHNALHAMFSFYSTGLLIIAMMILIYLVVVIVAETAQTGVPFGKRFNKVWAPIRLVFALGLLIPISNGLNSAQYIVLYSAKLGSNFATNGWIVFNGELTNRRMTTDQIIAIPKAPDVANLLQFMMLAHACKAVAEGEMKQSDIQGFAVAGCGVDGGDQRNRSVVNAYIVKMTGNGASDAKPIEETDYAAARQFFNNGDMTIRIGDRGCGGRYDGFSGHTVPTCGELVLTAPTQEANLNAGAYIVQEGYYNLVKYLWGEYIDGGTTGTKIWQHNGYCHGDIGGAMVQNYKTFKFADMTSGVAGDLRLRKQAIGYVQKELCPSRVKKDDATGTEVDTDYSLFTEPNIAYLSGTNVSYQYGLNNKPYPQMVDPIAGFSPDGVSAAIVTNIIREGVKAERNLVNAGRYSMPTDMIDRGWAGAGLWYNKIAAANGAISGAAQSTPRIVAYPELMEAVVKAKLLNNKNIPAGTMFSPEKGQAEAMALKRAGEAKAVMPLQRIYADWSNVADSYKPDTGNMIYDFINRLFGTQGLFDLRDPGNQGVHPLAQMTSMGKSLIEASIRNLGLAVGGNVAGGALASATEGLTISTSVASSFLFTIVTMTLGAGIILYYVLPFMPFVYFFFAVGSWIKEVFEAMVGVPLWALAHLRIDGDGLPGEAARSGYFMIFEIFLRPIMIVFGLIAAVSIFASMATVLNTVFNIAVVNAGGTNYANMGMTSVTEFARGPLDQLFYTILYAVLMYIIAMSSFKMIDLIPNQIMRWLGVSVSAFAAQTGDSAQNLMGNIQQQGLGKVDQAVGGLREGSKGVGDTLGKATAGK